MTKETDRVFCIQTGNSARSVMARPHVMAIKQPLDAIGLVRQARLDPDPSTNDNSEKMT